MNSRNIISSLLLLLVVSLNAQNNNSDSLTVIDSDASNWYMECGLGSQILLSSDAQNLPFDDRLTPAFSLTLGRWLAPCFALRTQFMAFGLNGFSTTRGLYLADPIPGNTMYGNNDPVRNEVDINPDGSYRHYIHYLNGHIDAVVSLRSLLKNDECKWDVLPAIGIGYMHVFDYKGIPSADVLTHHFSIMGKYHLNNKFDVNMELQSTLLPDHFDGRITGQSLEGIVGANIGLTYNFGKRRFKNQPQTNTSNIRVEYKYKTRIDTVYITHMAPPDTLIPQEEKSSVAIASILFPKDSKVCNKGQEISFINIAKYLKENPTKQVILEGYANKDTGSENYNFSLSQGRAEFIRAKLEVDHGANPDQIKIKAFGALKQPYQKVENNRVVIAVVK